MTVSSAGDLVYKVPRDYRNKLLASSLKLRAEPALQALGKTAAYLGRVAFGSALFVSVLVAVAAIFAIMSSQQSSSRSSDDRNNNRSQGSMGGGGFSFIRFDPYSLWFWDPYYSVKARQRPPQEMSFLESVFSLVFGDGDPNADFEENRWQRVAAYIQGRGGVVTALELAPLLDPPDSAGLEDEAFMVPALLKFDGEVRVTDEGHTLYIFPQFQRVTAGRQASSSERATSGSYRSGPGGIFQKVRSAFSKQPAPVPTAPLLEKPWTLTKAPPGNVFGAWALAAVNVGLVGYLTALVSGSSAYTLAQLPWISWALPPLQLYAALFVALPGIRWLLNAGRNTKIAKRNEMRSAAAAKLASPSPETHRRLAEARALAQTTTIRDTDVIYSTEQELGAGHDEEFASFDRRLQWQDKERVLEDR